MPIVRRNVFFIYCHQRQLRVKKKRNIFNLFFTLFLGWLTAEKCNFPGIVNFFAALTNNCKHSSSAYCDRVQNGRGGVAKLQRFKII